MPKRRTNALSFQTGRAHYSRWMTRRSISRLLRLGLVLALTVSFLRADRGADVALIHVEAIGGRERIDALRALSATGHVITGGKRVLFRFTAARPDRVRLESENGGRTLVQASDGVEPPWEFDSDSSPPHYRAMPEATAKTFLSDAEFDDPLIAGPARGFTFEVAGSVRVDGRMLLRVMVTRKLSDTFALFLDPETYLIMLRIEQRTSAGGRRLQIATRYDDFRPVEGVLLPHEITLSIDGRVSQQTKIEAITGNPPLAPEIFVRPRAGGETPK